MTAKTNVEKQAGSRGRLRSKGRIPVKIYNSPLNNCQTRMFWHQCFGVCHPDLTRRSRNQNAMVRIQSTVISIGGRAPA
uniref:Uncharacterized protein n=1 Tax=Candidatus Kentrum sp. MB TaxID=2138164 RepID=A0A450XAI6_9GAMM|nr:MAG: hypothetical protein BECKMB1821G_GA0114241_102013 [Candidatus Kentron sp. MB]